MDSNMPVLNTPQVAPKKNSLFSLTFIFILFLVLVIILSLYFLYTLFKKTPKKNDTTNSQAVKTTIAPNAADKAKLVSFKNIEDPLSSGASSFKTLEISDADANKIKQNIGKFTNLTEVYLERDNLTEIPTSLLSSDKLTTLWLPNNNIKSIPPSIKNLKNLQVINLTNNALEEIPKELGDLENLNELYLSSNNLSSLPTSLSKLSKLKILVLTGNKLSDAEKNKIEKMLPNSTVNFGEQQSGKPFYITPIKTRSQ